MGEKSFSRWGKGWARSDWTRRPKAARRARQEGKKGVSL
jgi:hypothetical protein